MIFGTLEGCVAIVTGPAANIGEACAHALAGAGASVVVADINLAGAQSVAAAIVAAGAMLPCRPGCPVLKIAAI